ncbi:cation:dicarboxylate symporter family transporter [Pseudomonas sp. DSP3-2-2]|uniref:cation:dicarboxylate symporter family transporter n=1 Tax=unclassified Pseudomonas TaxID=196821 RepID=UPI003CE93021
MPVKLLKNATLQILLAISCGVLLGLLRPDLAVYMKPLSDGFVKLIGLLMPFIMFLLVCSGVASLHQQGKHVRLVRKVFVYFQVMSIVSLLLGMTTALLFEMDASTVQIFPKGLVEAAVALGSPATSTIELFDEFSVGEVWSSIYWALSQNLVFQVMLLAVISGLLLPRVGRLGEVLQARLEVAINLLFRVLRLILKFAPAAAFGAMAFTVGKYGVESILPLLKFVVVMYLACALLVVFILASIARMVGISLWRLTAYIKEELLLVTFTGASVAAIPGLISKLEKLGCDRQVVRLVLTTGYTFNLSGSNIYLTTSVMFLAHLAGVELSSMQLIGVLLMCMLTSLGSTSVAGSAFFTLIATLNMLHVIPLESVGLLLGVERLMKCRSLTNVLGNCVACLVICRWQRSIDRVALRQALGSF